MSLQYTVRPISDRSRYDAVDQAEQVLRRAGRLA